tara:strand:- start:72 stop:755 length:684 start_codon:yes stop_codon:yes gene_type:complete
LNIYLNKGKMKKKFIDKQVSIIEKTKRIYMGKHVSYIWEHDTKHLAFSLSRYKFVSKMLEGYNSVLEVGAGDGFMSKIVKLNTKKLSLSDADYRNRDEFKSHSKEKNEYIVHDFTKKKLNRKFDGIYSLDVLEHIKRSREKVFIKNLTLSLNKSGSLIIGMPTIESQKYTTKINKIVHVNCKSKEELRKLMLNFFKNVFMFSMNDEVVHTGFDRMSNYIFAICANKK